MESMVIHSKFVIIKTPNPESRTLPRCASGSGGGSEADALEGLNFLAADVSARSWVQGGGGFFGMISGS